MKVLALLKTKLARIGEAAGGELQIVLTKLDEMLGALKTAIFGQKWCFAAGTAVMTLTGPLAIEQVQAGGNRQVESGRLETRPTLER